MDSNKINSRFKLHKFEFSILKWHFKTKISKIWNVHFHNRISDFILKNFPMFIPEIPIFNLKIRVWHFWTIFGRNRMSKTKNLTGKKTTEQGGKPTCRPGRVKLTSPVFTLVPDISTLLRVKWNFYYTKVGYFMNTHLVLWSEDLNIQNC